MMNWIDIETTGLNPESCWLLEVGLIVTDDNLEEVSRDSFLIESFGVDTLMCGSNAFVRDMHTENGLWEDLRREGGVTCARAENILLGKIVKGAPLCGSSVHFDRAWLRYKMPRLESLFGYRNIDVSTLKELYKRFRPASPPFEREKGHRVLADLDSSIAELRYYLHDMCWEPA